MKNYSQKNEKDRVVIPVVSVLPPAIEIGELVYLLTSSFPGLYVYVGARRWAGVYNTANNISEIQTTTEFQQIYELEKDYTHNGYSINVFVNGVKLDKSQFAETAPKIITIKDKYIIKGNEVIEFQMFNVPVSNDFFNTPKI